MFDSSYIPYFISGSSLILSFINWKDKKSDAHQAEIDDMLETINDLNVKVNVLEERILNEIKFTSNNLTRLNDKLDEIVKEL